MSKQSLTSSRRVLVGTCLAAMLTLVVWWQESGAVSSPDLSTSLLLLTLLGIAVIIWAGRQAVDDGVTAPDRPPQAPTELDQPPRRFAEVPREHRLRLFLVIASTAAGLVLVVPLVTVATMRGASLWQAAPLLVMLAAMTLAVIVLWRQARHPTTRTVAIEQRGPKMTTSRRVAAYLSYVPAYLLSSVVFQTLASSPPLAVTSAFAVNLIGAALVLVLDERLARKPAPPNRRSHPPR